MISKTVNQINLYRGERTANNLLRRLNHQRASANHTDIPWVSIDWMVANISAFVPWHGVNVDLIQSIFLQKWTEKSLNVWICYIPASNPCAGVDKVTTLSGQEDSLNSFWQIWAVKMVVHSLFSFFLEIIGNLFPYFLFYAIFSYVAKEVVGRRVNVSHSLQVLFSFSAKELGFHQNLSVCLWTTSLKNLWRDFDDIYRLTRLTYQHDL